MHRGLYHIDIQTQMMNIILFLQFWGLHIALPMYGLSQLSTAGQF